MRRLLPIVLVIVALPGVARAQTSVMNGGMVKLEPRLPDGMGGYVVVAPNLDNRQYERQFDLARCVCAEAGQNSDKTRFAVRMNYSTQPTSPVTDTTLQIWSGINCDDMNTANRQCGKRYDRLTGTDIMADKDWVMTVDNIVDPTGMAHCPQQQGKVQVSLFSDPNNDLQWDDKFSVDIPSDAEPPPAPSGFKIAAGGEGRIDLDWSGKLTETSDNFYYQILCGEVDPSAPDGITFPYDKPKDARYDTVNSVCGLDSPPMITAVSVDQTNTGPDGGMPSANDAGVDALPAPLRNLDARYICDEKPKGATSTSLDGLTNGKQYWVVLVATDAAGNPIAITPNIGPLTPQPSTDFWEELHDDGSQAQGGFCLIADTYGDGGGPGGGITAALRDFRDQDLAGWSAWRALIRAYYAHVAPLGELARRSTIARVVLALVLLPAVVLALGWHFLTLPGLIAVFALLVFAPRLRRARWLRPALTAGVLLIGSRVASAQDFAPYWDQGNDATPVESNTTTGPVDPSSIAWHVGIKLGPYIPDIDHSPGVTGAPYATMYGTKWHVLPVVEVDYLILHPPGGQLGIGGSIGWFSRVANSFKMGSTTERATGDTTRFAMIPVAADVVYRLTTLDDEYGIPVVPYLRGGLSYYVWYITDPNGSFADVMGNKARGASLGVQGSVGVALRAEEIDADAAAQMRDSGIDHAGFYAEYQLGWVDGFGKSTKLSLGDHTWFAGVDFEF